MIVTIRHHGVSDKFHGPELLVCVFDDGAEAVEDGGAVVVVVGVGRETQDEAVDLCGCDAEGETGGVGGG